MNFHFDLEAGWFVRKNVRRQLQNSKEKLEFEYPDCKVLLTENDGYFHFQAKNIPDSEEIRMRNWIQIIKKIAND